MTLPTISSLAPSFDQNEHDTLHIQLVPQPYLLDFERGTIAAGQCETLLDYLSWCYVKSDRCHHKLFKIVLPQHREVIRNTIEKTVKSPYRVLLGGERRSLTRIQFFNKRLYRFSRIRPSVLEESETPSHEIWKLILEYCKEEWRMVQSTFDSLSDMDPTFTKIQAVDTTPAEEEEDRKTEDPTPAEIEQPSDPPIEQPGESPIPWTQVQSSRYSFALPELETDLVERLDIQESEDNADSAEKRLQREQMMSRYKPFNGYFSEDEKSYPPVPPLVIV